MRDLERIREEDGRGAAARLGVMVLTTVVTVAVIYGVASMLGEAQADASPEGIDPLVALQDSLTEESSAGTPEANVDRVDLAFPEALAPGGQRPEVQAALAAAAAELAHPEPLPNGMHLGAAAEPLPSLQEATDNAVPQELPAAAAASGDHAQLLDTATRDPLLARSINNDSVETPRAREGRAGEYTLQVISYRTPEEAHLFSEALRQRGHEAFVMAAEVADRGSYWRVRVGPFETRGAARRYRREFERQEHMNVIVVKQEDQDA